MTINLRNFKAVQTGMFVKMTVPDYATMLFSNYNRPVTIGADTFLPLGGLLSVTDTQTSLRASPGSMSITISGVPSSSISEIINNKIKGSAIEIWRVFFDVSTGEMLNINGNPQGRFQGIVSNYSIEEDLAPGSTTAKNSILLTCSSTIDVLNNKVSGRKTNSNDEKYYYPSDLGMDRVALLANSNFNFGAVVK